MSARNHDHSPKNPFVPFGGPTHERKVLHYTEQLRILRNGTIELTGGGGFPVCVAGDEAYRIKATGNCTDNKLLVTCKRCLTKIRHELEGRIEERG